MLEAQLINQVPFEYKSDEMIDWAFNTHDPDKIAVTCSFGKDSLSVVDKARKIDRDVQILHALAMPFSETIQFKNHLISEWDLNVASLRPFKGMNFWKCVEKYGLPHIRSQELKSPKCCYYLKEKPIQNYIKKHNIQVVLTGLTAAESWNRRQLAHRYDNIEKMPDYMKSGNERDGINYCSLRYWSKTWDSWQIHPLMGWTEQDVWNYIHRENLPVNPVYCKWGGIYDRVGCVACTAYLDWEKKLPKSHPELYKKLKDVEFEQTGQQRLTSFKQTKRTRG